MEHSARGQILATATLHRIPSERFAAPVPSPLVNDGVVQAVVELALMGGFADVEWIAEQMVERASAKNDAPNFPAG
jgi:hypothetical protein